MNKSGITTNAPENITKLQKLITTKVIPSIVKASQVAVYKIAEDILKDLKDSLSKRKGIVVSKLGKRSKEAQELLSNEDIKAGLEYLDFVVISPTNPTFPIKENPMYITIGIPADKQMENFSLIIFSKAVEYGSKSLGIPATQSQRIVYTEYKHSVGDLGDKIRDYVAKVVSAELAKYPIK